MEARLRDARRGTILVIALHHCEELRAARGKAVHFQETKVQQIVVKQTEKLRRMIVFCSFASK